MRRFIFIFVVVMLIFSAIIFFSLPVVAQTKFGAPNRYLGTWATFRYSFSLLWSDGLLTEPLNVSGVPRDFVIEPGESVVSICTRLEEENVIKDSTALLNYLIYAGLDTNIQSGSYTLSPANSAFIIAHQLESPEYTDIDFYVLAGWRIEEIAESIPTSGLYFSAEDFLAAAKSPHLGLDFVPASASAEGFLFPGKYNIPRNIPAAELVKLMAENFNLYLTDDLRTGFSNQNLTVYEAVTLASIVQREAVQNVEKPLIASVYLNRLANGMKLEADPTTQYALGYNTTQQVWWTNPLSLSDLRFDSPFNTYVYFGLPPAPISNPDLDSLFAVAYPEQTLYLFFRARCDGSGYHDFAVTYDDHLANGCE